MGRFFINLILFFTLAGALYYYIFYMDGEKFGLDKIILVKGTINFSVQEFVSGGLIPIKFTCDGEDVSPSFLIERVPENAKSLVLIVDDPDAKPVTFTHYILFNIDPNIGSIDQGIVPGESVVATNDFGKQEYNGPCHALGTHKYYFKVYALDKILELDRNSNRERVDKAMRGSIIAKGEFTGEYSKN